MKFSYQPLNSGSNENRVLKDFCVVFQLSNVNYRLREIFLKVATIGLRKIEKIE